MYFKDKLEFFSTLFYLPCGWNCLVFCFEAQPLNTWATGLKLFLPVIWCLRKAAVWWGWGQEWLLPACFLNEMPQRCCACFLKSLNYLLEKVIWGPQNASWELSNWGCPFTCSISSCVRFSTLSTFLLQNIDLFCLSCQTHWDMALYSILLHFQIWHI